MLVRAICSALPVKHVYTGYDYTSAFRGVKSNFIQLILKKGQLESKMLLCNLDFPLTCSILQNSL